MRRVRVTIVAVGKQKKEAVLNIINVSINDEYQHVHFFTFNTVLV